MTIMADQAVTRERLLTPGEVAALFRVDPRTVTRWVRIGRLKAVRTPGGRRRYRPADIRALLATADETVEAVSA